MVEGLELPSIDIKVLELTANVKCNDALPIYQTKRLYMVIDIISKQRLVKYLRASGYDEEKALRLYGWNIEISESFYPLLSAVEVCLRNIISSQMIALYGNEWWESDKYLDQISNGKRIVFAARDKIRREGRVTSGKMIAELNFGFWSKMLLPRHKDVFWNNFRKCFRNLPDEITYEIFYELCDKVCNFRNRIFHHEPIFSRDISKDYQEIMELIKWLSPEKAIWIKNYSRVMFVLRSKP